MADSVAERSHVARWLRRVPKSAVAVALREGSDTVCEIDLTAGDAAGDLVGAMEDVALAVGKTVLLTCYALDGDGKTVARLPVRARPPVENITDQIPNAENVIRVLTAHCHQLTQCVIDSARVIQEGQGKLMDLANSQLQLAREQLAKVTEERESLDGIAREALQLAESAQAKGGKLREKLEGLLEAGISGAVQGVTGGNGAGGER